MRTILLRMVPRPLRYSLVIDTKARGANCSCLRDMPPTESEGECVSSNALCACEYVPIRPMCPVLITCKCNGERPACKRCIDRGLPCEYTAAPGLTPAKALKRKYEDLQAEAADEHDLLSLLRTGTEADAINVLAYLRSSHNIQATLQHARNIFDASHVSVALDPPSHVGEDYSASQLGLQSLSRMTDNPSTIAELTDRNEGAPWALPIEPYVCLRAPMATLCQAVVILRVPHSDKFAETRCLQSNHRFQWGEYLAAQDTPKNS